MDELKFDINTILFGITLPIVLTVLISILLGGREANIREAIKGSINSRRRRRYARALIGAIKGDVVVSHLEAAAYLLAALSMGAGVFITFNVRAGLDGFYRLEGAYGVVRSNGVSAAELSSKAPEEIRDELAQIRKTFVPISWLFLALGYGLWALYFWLIGPWRRFITLRARLAHQIASVQLTIKRLATTEELFLITATENLVTDERSLRDYIDALVVVATRLGHPKLVWFDPWFNERSSDPTVSPGTA